MSIRIAFSNQKGGVGKTTLTRELGLFCAGRGMSVLLVDCDPQGNLTKSLREEPPRPGLYELLDGEAPSGIPALGDNLSLLSGDIRLAALEKRLLPEIDCYTRLSELLGQESFSGFELILADTPPSLSALTVNALTAATHLVVPMAPALYSLQGTNDLMQTVAKVRKSLNAELALLGVVLNAYDGRPVITREITEEIAEAFGAYVFERRLSRSIRLEEAIASRESVLSGTTREGERVRGEVSSLGEEFLSRLGVEVAP
jgi:chromosome partitioning protein